MKSCTMEVSKARAARVNEKWNFKSRRGEMGKNCCKLTKGRNGDEFFDEKGISHEDCR